MRLTCPRKNVLEHDMSMKLTNLNELSAILGRSQNTIKKDLKRNPPAVPPRVIIPGTRLLRWRAHDVELWLAQNAEHVKEKRNG